MSNTYTKVVQRSYASEVRIEARSVDAHNMTGQVIWDYSIKKIVSRERMVSWSAHLHTSGLVSIKYKDASYMTNCEFTREAVVDWISTTILEFV